VVWSGSGALGTLGGGGLWGGIWGAGWGLVWRGRGSGAFLGGLGGWVWLGGLWGVLWVGLPGGGVVRGQLASGGESSAGALGDAHGAATLGCLGVGALVWTAEWEGLSGPAAGHLGGGVCYGGGGAEHLREGGGFLGAVGRGHLSWRSGALPLSVWGVGAPGGGGGGASGGLLVLGYSEVWRGVVWVGGVWGAF